VFDFNYVAIVPGKKGDFAGVVGNFFDDSHKLLSRQGNELPAMSSRGRREV
jgi:hypothetical protein